MLFILATLDTSHCDVSPLNNAPFANMWLMSVTRDTSHFEMPPLKFVLVNM